MIDSELLEYDKKHIWHPYASAINPQDCQLIHSADGVYLETAKGEKLIDGMSSWWAVIHGYNQPKLNDALSGQLKRMAHVMFGGITHKPAIDLAKKLLAIVPKGLEHVFYSDSGSVAVEVAMKMALQYWQAKGLREKNMFASLKHAYHGDTWHAMSVCDPELGMHHMFSNRLAQQYFIQAPQSVFAGDYKPEDSQILEQFFEEKSERVAAFILEPIVQGAGGMRFYHPNYLKKVKELCDRYKVLLIADEIATGFGRTGKLFACDYGDVSPDILCIGKALTGGYMSFAATLCTAHVAQTISESPQGVFMHGPTYMANPLACAVSLASIELLLESDWQNNINRIENCLRSELSELKNLKAVRDVRVLGAIGVVELYENVDMKEITADFVDQGIWLRPFGKLVYTMPPYIITNDQLKKMCAGIRAVITNRYGEQK